MSSRQRVLVIDDDPLFRGLIVSLLRRDYLVMVAKDGAEGFYRAIETKPEVAIIDVRMPGWDGIRTLKAFREHRNTSGCRVMMLTGDATRETVVSAIRLGADDYLIKTSFTNEELLEKVAALVQRSHSSVASEAIESVHDAGGPGHATIDDRNGVRHDPHEVQDVPPTRRGVASLQSVIDDWD